MNQVVGKVALTLRARYANEIVIVLALRHGPADQWLPWTVSSKKASEAGSPSNASGMFRATPDRANKVAHVSGLSHCCHGSTDVITV